MATWWELFGDIKKDTTGCPLCKNRWSEMNMPDSGLDRHSSSLEDALATSVICPCSWRGLMKDLNESKPGGWSTIKEWWREKTGTKMMESAQNKSVEDYIKEQIDSNLRAIFG